MNTATALQKVDRNFNVVSFVAPGMKTPVIGARQWPDSHEVVEVLWQEALKKTGKLMVQHLDHE